MLCCVSVSDHVKDQLDSGKPAPIIEEVDLASLAPRKPDWDLKRDVSKKLEKLEKRTQRAIAELIRKLNLKMFPVQHELKICRACSLKLVNTSTAISHDFAWVMLLFITILKSMSKNPCDLDLMINSISLPFHGLIYLTA